MHSLLPFHTADSLHAVHVDGRPLSRGAAGQAPRGLGPRACTRGGAGRRCLRPGRLSSSKPGGRRFKSCPRDQKHRPGQLSALAFLFFDRFVCRFVCRLRRRFCPRIPAPRTTSDVLRGGGMAAASRSRCRLFGAANLGSNPSAPATHFRRSDAILRLACFFGQQAVCCRGQHMGPFLGNLWAISWACPKIRTIFSQKPTRRVPPPDTSPPREPRRGLRQAFRRRTRLPPAALPAGSPVAAALLAPAAAPAHHSARRPGSIPS